MALTPETRKEADELTKSFFVPFGIEEEAQSIRAHVFSLPNEFRLVAESFVEHINATIRTTAAPFLLANAAAHDQQYQRIATAERIRARSIEAELGESEEALERRRDSTAHQVAGSRMKAFVQSPEGVDSLVHDTATFLLRLYRTADVNSVSREILLHGTVSTWSALEVLVSDGLSLLLDYRPHCATKLLADPVAKRKFEMPRLSADDLASRGFDLSKQMGRLLFEDRDLSNFAVLKSACEALLDAPALRDALASPGAWQLNQARHLIVHRRGIGDEEYIRKTGSSLKCGERIVITPNDVESWIRDVLKIGNEFLDGLSRVAADA